jgi:uncharacterized lipoprotein YddW (UPF0748 family)
MERIGGSVVVLMLGLLAVYPAPGIGRAVEAPPAPVREFRGVWVASVANIDWPSAPGLATAQQQAELVALLDRAAQLHLNAIVLQVRPACDALYASRLEPWSEFLTGEMGKAPSPYYDPLAFAVREAHRRGLELHAWFNPYRARHPAGKSAVSADHLSQRRPELVRPYGKLLWLDPGEPAVQDHSVAVISDVVARYDIDGVHLDDYFYPYKERDAAGRVLPFPDDPSWKRFLDGGGSLSRDDWRRQNVDRFISRLYRAIKARKPWVKLGISPFGIWRPGYPGQIKGFDPYTELYADSRKWLQEGWLDYFTPQLYWRIDPPEQSYPVLLRWWEEQNPRGRHLWPGLYTSRVDPSGSTPWRSEEIVNQVAVTRAQPGAGGTVHFSMKAIMRNWGGVADALQQLYAQPALVPATPWLDNHPPGRPALSVCRVIPGGALELAFGPARGERPWLWLVRVRSSDSWTTRILPAVQTSYPLAPPRTGMGVDLAAVAAVDRTGNLGPAAVVRLVAR